jgi:hypothetical protein
MKSSALQEFLRNLGGSLGAVGVPAKSVEDLRAVARALEPFRDLDLEQLADFLRRAAEFRRDGHVPAVSVAGLDGAMAAAQRLGELVQTGGADADIGREQKHLEAALGQLGGQFGLGVKVTPDKKWLAGLRAKGEVLRAVEGLRRLTTQITDPSAYQSDAVRTALDEFGRLDAKVLKAAGDELGASGTGKGTKYVESLLAKLTGIDSKPAKPAKGGKKVAEPAAPPEQVEAMSKELEDLVERSRDPDAVSDAEIDAILARLGSSFSTEQQKAIAKRVSGSAGRSAADAVNDIRLDLTAVKRLRESQRV